MAKAAPAKKKSVSKGQAMKVANFLKQQGNGGPAVPTPAQAPVVEDDDNDQSQGA